MKMAGEPLLKLYLTTTMDWPASAGVLSQIKSFSENVSVTLYMYVKGKGLFPS